MSLRALLSTWLLISLFITTNAESASKRNGISIGFMGGLSLCRFGIDQGSSFDILTVADTQRFIDHIIREGMPISSVFRGWERAQLNAGALFNYGLTDKFGLQPEFLYIRKVSATGDGVNMLTMTVHVDYLEIPVMLTYSPKTTGRFVPSIMVGPYVDIKLKRVSQTYVPAPLVPYLVVAPSQNGGAVRAAAYGVTVGLSLGMKTAHGVVFIAGRYDHGISTFIDGTYFSPAMKDRSIQLFAGYSFEIQ